MIARQTMLCAAMCLLLAGSAVWAQNGPESPPAAQTDSVHRAVPPPGGQSGSEARRVQGARRETGGGWLETLGALAAVAALLLAARYLVKRAGKNPVGGAPGVVGVLARKALGPRQELVLVRLGAKLILVGASPNGLNAISEVTDPQEVQRLVESAGQEASVISRLLGGGAKPPADPSASGVRNLAGKLRTLADEDKP